jgi:glycosyltransferase involved in cell wall biosynthesis
MKNKPIFSVLILSVIERIDMASKLFKKLESICKFDNVEILILMDNRKLSIPDKRNSLLDIANGDYIAFLDDDDDVFNDYFDYIVPKCMEQKYDVITFNQYCNVNGFEFEVTFDYGNPVEGVDYNFLSKNPNYKIKRPPWHLCVWKSDIAKSEKFLEVRNQYNESCEDAVWIETLNKKIKTHYKIDKTLHKYLYNSKVSLSAK